MEIKKTTFTKIMNIISLLGMLGMCIYLYVVWKELPEKIPVHFGASGQADRFSGKTSILSNPIIGWLLYGMLSFVEHVPQVWNTGVAVTEENRQQVYAMLYRMLVIMKFLLVVVFFYTTVQMARGENMHIGFMPVYLVLFFGTIVVHLIMLTRIGKKK